jgi:hypothetical protein
MKIFDLDWGQYDQFCHKYQKDKVATMPEPVIPIGYKQPMDPTARWDKGLWWFPSNFLTLKRIFFAVSWNYQKNGQPIMRTINEDPDIAINMTQGNNRTRMTPISYTCQSHYRPPNTRSVTGTNRRWQNWVSVSATRGYQTATPSPSSTIESGKYPNRLHYDDPTKIQLPTGCYVFHQEGMQQYPS